MLRPKCYQDGDCFAQRRGECLILKAGATADLRGRNCPFFQPREDVSWDNIHDAIKHYAETHVEEV